jgi:L-serine dehydratase
MDFKNAQILLKLCSEENLSIAEVMIRREIIYTETSRDIILSKMKKALQIMKDSAHKPLNTPIKSMGGLIGGESHLLKKRYDSDQSICGSTLGKAIMYSMAVLEVNASMGLIVAAPTAGSSGIVPGLLLTLQEEYDKTDDDMVSALFTASAIGYIAMRNATVAGAVGGCQAEVGIASAMAAAAAVELMGGTPKQALDAASTAISNLLGLVCDPIAGLVESPCQSRNVIGVSNALSCAEIALAGISQLIPFDEMLESMYRIGRDLPVELRETALGGCAATKTACAFACKH